MALTVGETLEITATIADATAAEVRLGGAGTGVHSMTADGLEWSVSVDTAEMSAGLYLVEVWATYPGGKKGVAHREQFTLSPALVEGDLRTNARKALDNINAMLGKQAGEGVKRYKINNRELERYSIAELLQLRSHFLAQVKAEERAAGGYNTLGPRIAVRF